MSKMDHVSPELTASILEIVFFRDFPQKKRGALELIFKITI